MRRFARRIALTAIGHAFPVVYDVFGRRSAAWFAQYVAPKVERMHRENLREFQREAFARR